MMRFPWKYRQTVVSPIFSIPKKGLWMDDIRRNREKKGHSWLGPGVVPFYQLFFGGVPALKLTTEKKGTLTLTSLRVSDPHTLGSNGSCEPASRGSCRVGQFYCWAVVIYPSFHQHGTCTGCHVGGGERERERERENPSRLL